MLMYVGKHIELRSDTFTKPTPGMRQAMMAAEVGDDCYKEDKTVARLEERVAGKLLFGWEQMSAHGDTNKNVAHDRSTR